MNKEQLKELNYPVVVENNGAIVGQNVNDFQEWLFYELVDWGMLKQDLWDIIDFQALENKYGQNYSVFDNETELLNEYNAEDLESND